MMWLKAKSKAKLKPELRRNISWNFKVIKLPCSYKDLGGMKSVKMFICKCTKLSFKKIYVKCLEKHSTYT